MTNCSFVSSTENKGLRDASIEELGKFWIGAADGQQICGRVKTEVLHREIVSDQTIRQHTL